MLKLAWSSDKSKLQRDDHCTRHTRGDKGIKQGKSPGPRRVYIRLLQTNGNRHCRLNGIIVYRNVKRGKILPDRKHSLYKSTPKKWQRPGIPIILQADIVNQCRCQSPYKNSSNETSTNNATVHNPPQSGFTKGRSATLNIRNALGPWTMQKHTLRKI